MLRRDSEPTAWTATWPASYPRPRVTTGRSVARQTGLEVHILNQEQFEKIEKIAFKKSDVIGEALCAVIANDSTARHLLLDSFKESLLMFPLPLRKVGSIHLWTTRLSNLHSVRSSGKPTLQIYNSRTRARRRARSGQHGTSKLMS